MLSILFYSLPASTYFILQVYCYRLTKTSHPLIPEYPVYSYYQSSPRLEPSLSIILLPIIQLLLSTYSWLFSPLLIWSENRFFFYAGKWSRYLLFMASSRPLLTSSFLGLILSLTLCRFKDSTSLQVIKSLISIIKMSSPIQYCKLHLHTRFSWACLRLWKPAMG